MLKMFCILTRWWRHGSRYKNVLSCTLGRLARRMIYKIKFTFKKIFFRPMWPQMIVFDTWKLGWKANKLAKIFFSSSSWISQVNEMVLANPKTPLAKHAGVWPLPAGVYWMLTRTKPPPTSATHVCASLVNSLEMWGQLLSYFHGHGNEVQRTREVCCGEGTQPLGLP